MIGTRTAMPHQPQNPIRTLIGIIGLILGGMFLLQAFNILNLTFYMTNNTFLKIFAVYAIISGILLLVNMQRRAAIIRY